MSMKTKFFMTAVLVLILPSIINSQPRYIPIRRAFHVVRVWNPAPRCIYVQRSIPQYPSRFRVQDAPNHSETVSAAPSNQGSSNPEMNAKLERLEAIVEQLKEEITRLRDRADITDQKYKEIIELLREVKNVGAVMREISEYLKKGR